MNALLKIIPHVKIPSKWQNLYHKLMKFLISNLFLLKLTLIKFTILLNFKPFHHLHDVSNANTGMLQRVCRNNSFCSQCGQQNCIPNCNIPLHYVAALDF